jgi:hypothetical protein
MKPFFNFLLLGTLSLSAGCSSSTSAENRSKYLDEDEMAIGDYLHYKTEVYVNRKIVMDEAAQTVWQFTKDSVYTHYPCYLEARPKKEGYNFKDVWYDIEEVISFDGDKFSLEVTSNIQGEMTSIYFFKPFQLNQDQKDFRKSKVIWDCLMGKKWFNSNNVTDDRKSLTNEQLGFSPIDTLDFTEQNSENYHFSADTLFYKTDSTEHLLTMNFLHRFGDMRLLPLSQCNCNDKFLGYQAK